MAALLNPNFGDEDFLQKSALHYWLCHVLWFVLNQSEGCPDTSSRTAHSSEKPHLDSSKGLGISDYMVPSKKSETKSRIWLHTWSPPFFQSLVHAKLKRNPFCKIPSQILKNEPSLFQGCGCQSLKCQRKPAKQRVFFSRSIFLLMYSKGNLCWLALGEILIIQSFWVSVPGFVFLCLYGPVFRGVWGVQGVWCPRGPLQLVVLA